MCFRAKSVGVLEATGKDGESWKGEDVVVVVVGRKEGKLGNEPKI